MSDKSHETMATIPPPMPPEIAAAIVKVMSKVERIEKDAEASGSRRFRYASVDQFYELLGPLMADAGILTLAHEGDIVVAERVTTDDRGGERRSSWLNVVFYIWIYHATGVSYGPIKREIQIIASGPQSYGMGPSFVVKYFLRDLFKVPTGEEEVDNHPKNGLPSQQQERPRDPPKETRDPPKETREKEKGDAHIRAYADKCAQEWAACKSQADMGAWWSANQEERRKWFGDPSRPEYIKFKDAFQAHGAKLPEKSDAKPKDDIPGFQGDAARQSESQIRMNFKAALVRCIDRDGCNDAFIKEIEPHEKSLSKTFLDEMYKMLQARGDALEKSGG